MLAHHYKIRAMANQEQIISFARQEKTDGKQFKLGSGGGRCVSEPPIERPKKNSENIIRAKRKNTP